MFDIVRNVGCYYFIHQMSQSAVMKLSGSVLTIFAVYVLSVYLICLIYFFAPCNLWG